jgi:DnaJ-domain-containing protein 1
LPIFLAVGLLATVYDLGFLRWIALLLAAPAYTVVGVIAICLSENYFHTPNLVPQFPNAGYIWVAAKVVWWWHKQIVEQRDIRAYKAAREERIKKEEETAQREFEEERAVTYTENKELVNQAVELVSSAGSKAVEMMRAAKAIGGRTAEVLSPERLFLVGVLQILGVFSEAIGAVSSDFARLIHGMQWRLEPTTHVRVHDFIGLIERQHSAVSVPMMVLCLAAYDQMQRTKLSTQAATIYCSIVQTASHLCGSSVAAKLVSNKYTELLRPYIPAPGNGNAANSSSSDRASSGGAAGKCPDCAKYYTVLGLCGNATEAEVKQAYRDLVKVWHPDRFSENDERLRRKAGERLREINEAYSHISKHWEPPRQ